jgi:hypothetical protein
MITALFMGWTDHTTGNWFPIRKMSTAKGYEMTYLNGVFSAIETAVNMRAIFEKGVLKPDEVRTSTQIPNIFAERLPIARPEDARAELELLDLKSPFNPIDFGARCGGYSVTDNYDLFPEVTPDADGHYHFYFPARNLPKSEISAHDCIDRLSIGQNLEFDLNGSIVHGGDVLGRLPGYLIDLVRSNLPLEIEVAKINPQIGWRYYHLFCHVTVKAKPFAEAKYQQARQAVVR